MNQENEKQKEEEPVSIPLKKTVLAQNLSFKIDFQKEMSNKTVTISAILENGSPIDCFVCLVKSPESRSLDEFCEMIPDSLVSEISVKPASFLKDDKIVISVLES